MSQTTPKTEKRSKTYILIPIFIFVLTVLTTIGISFLYQKTTADMIRNSILATIGAGTVVFLMAQSYWNDSFGYDNKEHYGRFLLFYVGSLIIACISPLLPEAGWPFAALFVMLSIFSNIPIGLAAGATLLMISVLLANTGAAVFCLYFICGLVVTALFSHMDETYKIGWPVAISLLVLLVCQTAVVVIYVNEHWNYELFLIPLISLLVNGIAIFAVLKYFSYAVIHKETFLYMAINDQEYSLLVELKKLSAKEYYRAVHTVHFCERIADKLGMDVQAAKAGGYYHRIGLLKGENTFEHVKEIYEEHLFPKNACRVLQEYNDPATPMESKEVAVVFLADNIISSIMSLFDKETDKIDYDKLIDTVFDANLEKGILNKCTLTLSDVRQMKEIFKKEKLYYDFLR